MISLVNNESFSSYRIHYLKDGVWHEIPVTPKNGKIKVHRFDEVWGNKVKKSLSPKKNENETHVPE